MVMKSFSDHLFEKETKASCEKLLQKYVFGEFQGKEDDTAEEAKMYQQVLKWLRWSDRADVKSSIETFKRLRDCKKFYATQLAPKAKTVYRGNLVPTKLVFKGSPKTSKPVGMDFISFIKMDGYMTSRFSRYLLKAKGGKSIHDLPDFASLEKERQKIKTDTLAWLPYNYTPNRAATSWSSEFRSASRFAFSDDDAPDTRRWDLAWIPVVMEAKVDDRFVMNAKLMNALGKKVGFHHDENEVILVGKKPLKVKMHFMLDEYAYKDFAESGKI